MIMILILILLIIIIILVIIIILIIIMIILIKIGVSVSLFARTFDIPTDKASEYNKSRRTAQSQNVSHCNNQPTK